MEAGELHPTCFLLAHPVVFMAQLFSMSTMQHRKINSHGIKAQLAITVLHTIFQLSKLLPVFLFNPDCVISSDKTKHHKSFTRTGHFNSHILSRKSIDFHHCSRCSNLLQELLHICSMGTTAIKQQAMSEHQSAQQYKKDERLHTAVLLSMLLHNFPKQHDTVFQEVTFYYNILLLWFHIQQ